MYIIPNLLKGGAERMVIDLVRELASRPGFEVKLVILHNDIAYQTADIAPYIHHIPATINISIWKKNSYNIEALQKFVEEFKPDIIHSQLFEAEIVSRSIYYPKAKWFTLCQDNMYQFENFSMNAISNKRKLTSFYEKNYLFKNYKKNGGTHFIVISKDTKQYYEKNAALYPATLMYNTINYDRFFKPKEIGNASPVLKLINTGSFVDKKNQQFLIDVAEVLAQRKINFELHLLGDGVNRKRLEKQADILITERKIFFHGNVHDVESYLWQCDIYLHSATYEPFGLVLVEAMAAGLPVVALDGKGNRDLIEEGKNGYMFFEQHPEKFADRILEIWHDKEKLKSLSGYAQTYAKQYDVKTYMDNLIRLYNA